MHEPPIIPVLERLTQLGVTAVSIRLTRDLLGHKAGDTVVLLPNGDRPITWYSAGTEADVVQIFAEDAGEFNYVEPPVAEASVLRYARSHGAPPPLQLHRSS